MNAVVIPTFNLRVSEDELYLMIGALKAYKDSLPSMSNVVLVLSLNDMIRTLERIKDVKRS